MEVHSSNGNTRAPFEGDYIVLGHGGKEGFSVMGKSLGLLTKPPTAKSSSEERLRYWIAVGKCSKRIREFVAKSMSEEELTELGLIKIGGIVTIIANGRHFSDTDVEHMMCKLYLLLQRYRGSRAFSNPAPWRPHCHPTISRDFYDIGSGLDAICCFAIISFRKRCQDDTSGSMSDFKAPFTVITV